MKFTIKCSNLPMPFFAVESMNNFYASRTYEEFPFVYDELCMCVAIRIFQLFYQPMPDISVVCQTYFFHLTILVFSFIFFFFRFVDIITSFMVKSYKFYLNFFPIFRCIAKMLIN